LLDIVLSDPRTLRKHARSQLRDEDAAPVFEWLRSVEPSVDTKLTVLQEALWEGDDSNNSPRNIDAKDIKTQFRDELFRQRKMFKKHHGWTEKQYSVAVSALIRLGNLCASRSIAPPLEVAWLKLKEAGFNMDQATLHNYLYVSSTFSLPSARRLSSLSTRFSRNSSGSVLDFLDELSSQTTLDDPEKSSKKEKDLPIDVAAEVALCHNFLFGPSEQTTMIHVRVLVSQGRPNEAEKLLDSSQVSR
jgi:hypothetical protein